MGDLGSIPGSGRSPGEGNGNPLQYSCLENFMDGGAWWATVHGVAKSQTRLSNFIYFTHSDNRFKNQMAFAGLTPHGEEDQGVWVWQEKLQRQAPSQEALSKAGSAAG